MLSYFQKIICEWLYSKLGKKWIGMRLIYYTVKTQPIKISPNLAQTNTTIQCS